MKIQSVYNHLPVFMQNLACSWQGRRLLKTRYGQTFQRLLAELNEMQWWEEDRTREYQNQRVRELMSHAYENVPYYNRAMKERGLTPKDFEVAEDIKKMPVLTKDIVRSEKENLLSHRVNASWKVIRCHTSGTTGKALDFFSTDYARWFQWAVWWRHRCRFGLSFGMLHANFSGKAVVPFHQKRPPFWRKNSPLNQIYCSTYHLNDESIPYYIEMLEKHPFDYYAGYPSSFYLLADYLRRHQRDFQRPVTIISTGAAALLPFQRETIHQWLKTPTTDQYGMAEGVANASRCRFDKYHIDMDFAVVENQELYSTPEGCVSKILGTGLHNYAFPLIRYDTGDVATFRNEKCQCGCRFPIIGNIEGRSQDCLITHDGKRIYHVNRLLGDQKSIKELQIVQHTVHQVMIHIVPEATFSKQDEGTLIQNFKSLLGNEVQIDVVFVDKIQKSKTSKFRMIVNHIQ